MDRLLWIAQDHPGGRLSFCRIFKNLCLRQAGARGGGELEEPGPIGMTHGQAIVVGILEIAGAVGVLVPEDVRPPWVSAAPAACGAGSIADGRLSRHLSRLAPERQHRTCLYFCWRCLSLSAAGRGRWAISTWIGERGLQGLKKITQSFLPGRNRVSSYRLIFTLPSSSLYISIIRATL